MEIPPTSFDSNAIAIVLKLVFGVDYAALYRYQKTSFMSFAPPFVAFGKAEKSASTADPALIAAPQPHFTF